jgi:hypothetical protein
VAEPASSQCWARGCTRARLFTFLSSQPPLLHSPDPFFHPPFAHPCVAVTAAAPYLLQPLADGFSTEPPAVRLALLTAAAKIFFKRPPEGQKLLGACLAAGLGDTDQDVHDRALLYYRWVCGGALGGVACKGVRVCVCVCVCARVCVPVCARVCMRARARLQMHATACVHVCTCMCVCVSLRGARLETARERLVV